MNWVTHKPTFEFDNFSPFIRANTAWLGHLEFAYDLVRFEKPEILVELGTHLGASFQFLSRGKGWGIIYKMLCCRYLDWRRAYRSIWRRCFPNRR